MALLTMISGSEILLVLFFLFSIGLFGLLPLLALIDIVKSRFDGNNKLVWVLIVIFVNVLGAILYFAIGRNQKINDSNEYV